MTKAGFLVYKCRTCDEIFHDLHAPDIWTVLNNILYGKENPNTERGMTITHGCSVKLNGVADLIGIEYSEE